MAVTDTPQSSSPPTEPFVPITSSAWWHRHLDPEERRRVMAELAITRVEHWAWRFTIMLTLSVVVAVMGLSADSAAVVIGAMLLAPLMQPVLATAACLSMSLKRKTFAQLLRVALATAWCVGIAFLLSMVLPDGALPAEVEARTRPDVRDLVVALAAGAAGAYATVRKDASSSLPGVAVAVALVPPLAAIGITLEAGERDLAIGATLLYSTNLAAIIFAGVMVFIATGFVPPKRLANTALQLLVAAIIALAVVVVVAVPLFDRSAEAVAAAEDEIIAASIVAAWLDPIDLEPSVDVQDDSVFVELRGFPNPPDDGALREQLRQEFGESTSINVQWFRPLEATTTTTVVVTPTEEEELIARIAPVVDGWLAESDDGANYERDGIEIVDGGVVVEVAGAGDPPPVEELIDRLSTEIGTVLDVSLTWTQQETVTTEPEATEAELMAEQIEPLVQEWAEESGVTVTAFAFDGRRVSIEAFGPTEPRIEGLIDDLRDAIGPVDGRPVPVDVFFLAQQRLTTTIFVFDTFDGVGPLGPTTTTTTTGGGPSPTSGG